MVPALLLGLACPGSIQAQTAAPAPAAPATPDAKAPGVGGTPATVIDEKQIESLLGKKAMSNTGDDMGRIVDVLADKSGQVRAAVIDFGGFFGVGSRKIAVDWRSLHFPPDAKADDVVVDLPRNELRVAPVYKEGEPVVVLGPAAAAKPADTAAASTMPPPPAPAQGAPAASPPAAAPAAP